MMMMKKDWTLGFRKFAITSIPLFLNSKTSRQVSATGCAGEVVEGMKARAVGSLQISSIKGKIRDAYWVMLVVYESHL